MGWSRLLLVKRKGKTKTTTTRVSGHDWKPLMPIMTLKDHWLPLWRRNANIPEAGLWERFIYVYHGTAISQHSGCRPSTWSRFYWNSSEQPEREIECYTWHPYEPRSHATTPRCLSCPQPTYRCTLNSCKEGFQLCFAPTTPSEESLSIKLSKKRCARTYLRQGDQGVQFEAIRCEQILIDRRV